MSAMRSSPPRITRCSTRSARRVIGGSGSTGRICPGSESATEFVAWYNGHPDYADMDFDLSCKRAVVIGNGNVALDVARMLALSVDELQVTDIADHSIELLRDSNIEEIVVLGRRGPAQAAFTNPELRELADLELADVIVDPADMELDPDSAATLETADGTIQRNVETLTSYSTLTPSGKPRRVVLRFLTSPVAIEGTDKVEALVVERNELIGGEDGTLKARADRGHASGSRPGWCCAPSVMSASRFPACRSTIAARPCSTRADGCSTPRRGSRSPGCMPPAGSSAAPPA